MTIANRTIFTGDNLYVLRGMESESVDLIYLDPPFNSNRNYIAPIGTPSEGSGFDGTWTLMLEAKKQLEDELQVVKKGVYYACMAAGQCNGDKMQSYLIYMALRMKGRIRKKGRGGRAFNASGFGCRTAPNPCPSRQEAAGLRCVRGNQSCALLGLVAGLPAVL